LPAELPRSPAIAGQNVPSHDLAKDLFDRTADDYQRRSEHRVTSFSSLIFQRRIEIVSRSLDRIPSPGRVLDYGMGPAVFARRCVELGLEYVGIDISPVMVQRAQALGLAAAQYRVGDLVTLSDYERAMDGVLAIGLLDYLEDPQQGLAALAKCVTNDGVLVVSFRNRRSLPRLLRDFARRLSWPWRGRSSRRAFFGLVHERSFDAPSELLPALRRVGFDRFETAYFNCSPCFFDFPMPGWLWRSWRRWDAAVASPATRYFCSGGVLVARKRADRTVEARGGTASA
jgi:SAM-dependent methyltransferase